MFDDDEEPMTGSVQIWRGRALPAEIACQIGFHDADDWIIVVPSAYQDSQREAWLSDRMARNGMKQRRVPLQDGGCAIIASPDKSRFAEAGEAGEQRSVGADSVIDWIY